MNSTVQLGLCQQLRLVHSRAKDDDLSVTATHNDLISAHGANRLDTLGTSINIESQRLIFNLEREQVTRLRTRKKIVFSVLAESHACVVSNNGASVDQITRGLARDGVQLPEGHLALAGDSKLVVSGVPALVVLGVATPGKALGRLTEH